MTQLSKTLLSHVDVLIVGAGPAGLMACNALARAGINVRIIDQRSIPVRVGQADGFQPRTLEVFQSYGLLERVLNEGVQMHIATFFEPGLDGGIRLVNFAPDVTAPSARYPFEVLLHQGGIEAVFLDSMRSLGVEVDRPIKPISIQLNGDPAILDDRASYPVRVTLKNLNLPTNEGDTEIVHAKYVIGADGAHSWTRKSLGIVMEGEQADSVWGVVDMLPEEYNFPYSRTKAIIHSNNGTCMNIPREDDKVRLYVQLEEKGAINESMGRVDKNKIGEKEILEVAAKTLHPYTVKPPKECEWWTVYRVGQRVASKFSIRERIFIAGDACHTHSPKAGQGMNASMNDTHNLAWKLVHVIRGWANVSLLKTYEFERKKYARDLIEFDKEFAHLFASKPRTAGEHNGVSPEVMLRAFTTFGGFSSGIGVHYNDSAIVNSKHQTYAKGLVAGERVPPQTFIRAADGRPYELQDLLPSDTRFKLLIFAGDISVQDQLEKVRTVADHLFAKGRGLWKCVFPGEQLVSVFDVLTICKTSLRRMIGLIDELPKELRSHWSRVFVDDKDIQGKQGGNGYANFGINPTGVVVIVRPDGYVGTIVPFDNVKDVEGYFASFMGSYGAPMSKL